MNFAFRIIKLFKQLTIQLIIQLIICRHIVVQILLLLFYLFAAAQAAGTIFILSTLSTSSIEEVAEAAPKCVKWFQLYVYTDRNVTINLIKRAENAGFKALVLTIDSPFFGDRRADIRNKFSLPSHLRYPSIEFNLI